MAELINIVTGFKDEPHVTSADDGSLNAGIFGEGTYILSRGQKMRAEIVNANTVRIYDGDVVIQGRQARIETGNYVELTIDNGAQGMKRNDLVVARYIKDASTQVESVELDVIKGTATSGTPSDPSYTNGNIFSGAILAEYPLYRITVNGLTPQTPIRIAPIVESISGIADYPVEIGTSNSWEYQKWASGRFTATREIYWASIPMTAAASGGSYALKNGISLPSGLASAPKIWPNCSDSTGYVVSQAANIGTSTFDLRIAKLFVGGNLDETHFVLKLDGKWA